MGELTNCRRCDKLFIETKFRDVCDECYKEEEKDFEKVYNYIRKRENRTAAMDQVIEATGVEEELIIKYIKKGRLKLAQFPKLGYKCDRCGATIREGRLCSDCSKSLRTELHHFEEMEEQRKAIEERGKNVTYYTKDHKHPL
ncbi:TIGR03826 family flagellar region protein [Bacillus sp. 1P06AnD]|uniref:TIGR03826 family flagellar region protein n=1 Tax=Bacillus sp. 1P06AnD TaxID=3132208 RepID=UPI0039A0E16B